MTIKKKSFDQGIKLKPTTEALTDKGELSYSDSDNKLKYKDDSATRTVVNTDGSQTLTNKTISSANNTITVDADTATVSNLEVDNLKSGVLDTDLTAVSGAHDTLPSAKAVKDYVDAQVDTVDTAAEIAFTDSPAFPGTPTNVQDALNELNDKVDANATSGSGDLSSHISDVSTHGISVAIVGTTETQTLTNKTLTSPTITGASIQTPSRLDMKQDTEANLTTYASTASNGQLVFATDTKKVYQVKDTLLAEIGGGGSGGTSIEITQASHGFIVGDGIYHNGSSWVKGQANAVGTLARFTVFSVPSANQFVAYSFGRVTVTGHGFSVGNFYYLSPSTAGLPTLTEPTSASHFSNPLFFVESSSILIAFVYRPLKAATNLDDLADVSTSGATNGQALIFNGSSWSPADVVQNAGDVIYDNSSSALTAIDVQAAIDEIDVDIDDLNTLSGVAKNAQNLGTFTGTTIADNTTIKPALQSLETAQESTASSLSSHIADTTTHGTTGDIVGTTDTQTLTNKTVNDNTFTIQDNTDNTKKLQFEASAISASTTRTLTAPNANTTIVGTDVAQVITLKDIDGGTASNTNRITLPKDTRANLDSLTRKAGTSLFDTTNGDLLIDNGTGLFEVNTNGTKNYIKYSNADRTISGWNLYEDAAAITPDNSTNGGTGNLGTQSCSLARSSDSPMRGLYSFRFSKPATNQQGEGFSYDFTIDSADKNNVLEISFDYDAGSSNFSTGTTGANYLDDFMSIFILDVTNGQLIRFNGEELKGKTNGKFLAFFQASQSTNYRLIAHVVTTTTTAWDVKFDNFSITPTKINTGLKAGIVGEIIAYTSNSIPYKFLQCNGSAISRSAYGKLFAVIGTTYGVGDGSTTFNLPDARGIFLKGSGTNTKITKANGGSYSGTLGTHENDMMQGHKHGPGNNSAGYSGKPGNPVTGHGASGNALAGDSTTGDPTSDGTNGTPRTGNETKPANVAVNYCIRYEEDLIVDDYSGRFHTATMYRSTSQNIAGGTPQKVQFNMSNQNTTGMADTSNYRVNVVETGYYDVNISLMLSSTDTTTNYDLSVRKNGAMVKEKTTKSGSGGSTTQCEFNLKSLYLTKGDYLEVWISSGADTSFDVYSGGADNSTFFTVTKIANPVDVVKSNETVYVYGKSNSNQSITANSTNVAWTEVTDSHNAWDGAIFTAPITGDYIFDGSIRMDSSAVREVKLYVNSTYKHSLSMGTYGLNNSLESFNGIIRLNKNDTMSIRLDTTSTTTNVVPEQHHITIRKLN